MIVELWTDGSGTKMGEPGGWAFLLRATVDGELHEREGVGYEHDTTSQRMELAAVIEGLRALNRPCRVRVFSDSEYVIKGFTEKRIQKWRRNGWKTSDRRAVANRDLWICLAAAARLHEIEWRHVRGHSGVEHNERVDKLAGRARLVAKGEVSPLDLLKDAA